MEDTVLFGFIDNRHALLEWDKAKDFGWSVELDTSIWEACDFKGTTLIKIYCGSYNQLTELPDLSKCVSLLHLACFRNQLTEEPKVLSGTNVYN